MSTIQLYKSNIIEHYRNPKNSGALKLPTHKSKVSNSTCGDEVELHLEIKDGIIQDIRHDSRGCAICVASMSILTDQLKGKPINAIDKLTEKEVLDNVGMDEGSGRLKCALIAYQAIKKAK